MEFKDFNSYKINIDTNVKSLKKSNSKYFIKSDSDANVFLMDMYSLYQLSYKSSVSENKYDAFDISKILTLQLSPNKFLSDFYLDRFFIINGDSVKLFDNNFLLINSKNFDHKNNLVYYNSKLPSFDSNANNKVNYNDQYNSNPQSIFKNMKYYSLLNNQISNFKTTIANSSYNLNPNFNLKNINNLFNKSKQTNSNNLFSNTASTNKEENSNANFVKDKIYEKGSFVGNPNLLMLSNKETISLCDFRVFNYF